MCVCDLRERGTHPSTGAELQIPYRPETLAALAQEPSTVSSALMGSLHPSRAGQELSPQVLTKACTKGLAFSRLLTGRTSAPSPGHSSFLLLTQIFEMTVLGTQYFL